LSLTNGAPYRICVFGSQTGEMLGFADISPVAGGMKKLATSDTYAFQDGRTLPIKFRIEEGALCANPQDCTEFTVGSTGGDFTVPSKHAALSVPAGAVHEGDVVTVVVEREDPQYDGQCLPTDIVQSKGCYHFRSEPALYQFATLVRLEACVDVNALSEEQIAALRLYKYNQTEGLQQLAQAAATLIDCSGFIALAEPADSPSSTFAGALLRDFGRLANRLFGPRTLFARPPMPPPTGLGGMGGSFSDVGGAVPGTATQAEVLLTVPETGTVGQSGLVATASGGTGTGAFSYASLSTNVCTVDATTGDITTLTPGTCTLTATKAGNEIYQARQSAPATMTVVPGLPDLVVSYVGFFQSTQGGSITFTDTVSNAGGDGPAGNSTFDVAVYLSSDQVLDEGDVQVGWGYSVWQYHLSVGWSRGDLMTNIPIPDNLPPGTYYLIVLADAFPGQPPNNYPGVTEANETNNWRASTSTVTVITP
jgi:hypothetical protein